MTFGRVVLVVVAWLALDLLIVAVLALRARRHGSNFHPVESKENPDGLQGE